MKRREGREGRDSGKKKMGGGSKWWGGGKGEEEGGNEKKSLEESIKRVWIIMLCL